MRDPMQSVVDQMAVLDRRVRNLEGGQRSALASNQGVTTATFTPASYDVYETVLDVTATFTRSLIIARVTYSDVGVAAPVFGVEGIDFQLIVDGVDILRRYSGIALDFDSETVNLIGLSEYPATGEHIVELQVYEREGGGSGATHPWAFVSADLFYIPLSIN